MSNFALFSKRIIIKSIFSLMIAICKGVSPFFLTFEKNTNLFKVYIFVLMVKVDPLFNPIKNSLFPSIKACNMQQIVPILKFISFHFIKNKITKIPFLIKKYLIQIFEAIQPLQINYL